MNQPESWQKNYAGWRRSAAREARLRAARAARPLAEDGPPVRHGRQPGAQHAPGRLRHAAGLPRRRECVVELLSAMTDMQLHFVEDEQRKRLQAAATVGYVERRSISVITTYAASIICMAVVLRGAPGCTRMRCVNHCPPACACPCAPYTTCTLPAADLSILTLDMTLGTRRSARSRSYALGVDVAPRSEKDALCACCDIRPTCWCHCTCCRDRLNIN